MSVLYTICVILAMICFIGIVGCSFFVQKNLQYTDRTVANPLGKMKYFNMAVYFEGMKGKASKKVVRESEVTVIAANPEPGQYGIHTKNEGFRIEITLIKNELCCRKNENEEWEPVGKEGTEFEVDNCLRLLISYCDTGIPHVKKKTAHGQLI